MVQNERIVKPTKVRRLIRQAEMLAAHLKANDYERATCLGIAGTIKKWQRATPTQQIWLNVLAKQLKKRVNR